MTFVTTTLRSPWNFRAFWLCLSLATVFSVAEAARNDLYPQVVSLEQRVTQLERVVDNDALVDILTRLDQIQAEVAALRSDVEELQFESEQSGNRQRELYLDIDRRLQAVESSAAATETAVAGAVVGGAALNVGQLPVPGGTAEENYQATFELLKQGRYEEAQLGFQQFIAAYPDNELCGNARYWQGEAFLISKKFDEALTAFNSVMTEYPASRKVPDSLLKIGFTYYELENWSQSRKAFNAVLNRYPESTAAKLATERLQKLDQEGR